MMTPQTPAEGIMLQKDFPDAKFYSVACSCSNPDDEIAFSVEASDWGEITLTNYTKQKTSFWDDPFSRSKSYAHDKEWQYQISYHVRNILNGLAHRLKVTWTVWVHGYVEYSQTTILTKQQAVNYAATLNQAVKDLEDFKKPKNE